MHFGVSQHHNQTLSKRSAENTFQTVNIGPQFSLATDILTGGVLC